MPRHALENWLYYGKYGGMALRIGQIGDKVNSYMGPRSAWCGKWVLQTGWELPGKFGGVAYGAIMYEFGCVSE